MPRLSGSTRRFRPGAMIIFVFLLAQGAPGDARAGAWTQRKGEGVVIISLGRQGSPVSMLTLAAEEEEKASAQGYVEYGISDRLTIGGAIFSDIAPSSGEGSANVSGFVRRRVWQGESSVASVQFGGSYPIESLIGTEFGESRPDSTPELRLSVLGGTSWWGDWGSVFTSGTIGYAWRSEGAADEIRSELTTGYAPWRCCLAIVSLYGVAPLDGEDNSFVIAPSVAYHFYGSTPANGLKEEDRPKPYTLQAGFSYDFLDDEGFGVTVSLWKKF
ncbi:MAG: hypothetical protein AAFR84_19880 [Pseudomonadota bacterium]